MSSVPTQIELDRMISSLAVYDMNIQHFLAELALVKPNEPAFDLIVNHANIKKDQAQAIQDKLREALRLRPILDKSDTIQSSSSESNPERQLEELKDQASDIKMSIVLSIFGAVILFGIGIVCLLITFGIIPYKTEMLHDAFGKFACLHWLDMSEEAMCTCAGVSCGCNIGLVGGLGALLSAFSSAGTKMQKLHAINRQLSPIKQRLESNAAYIANVRSQKEEARKNIAEAVLEYTRFMEDSGIRK